jgi:hypothetical protein
MRTYRSTFHAKISCKSVPASFSIEVPLVRNNSGAAQEEVLHIFLIKREAWY